MFFTFAIECDSLEQFLDYWSAKYRDPKFRDRDLYDPYVGEPMTAESRHVCSSGKMDLLSRSANLISVEKHYPLSIKVTKLSKYLDPVGDGGAIWNIFYMHCVSPQTWPIFHQHTYRAMHFLNTGEPGEIPSRKADIYAAYQREYIPFVKAPRYASEED
jgi:hypothetical protein